MKNEVHPADVPTVPRARILAAAERNEAPTYPADPHLVSSVALTSTSDFASRLSDHQGRALPPAENAQVTVVIPTRNEAGNVRELLRRLESALGSIDAEILFVDDSDDDTPVAILELAERSMRPVWLLHRSPVERRGGLGGAVADGFRRVRTPWAVVMDGDLQHPPDIVPILLSAGIEQSVDLVVASRYQTRGASSGLDGHLRVSISAVCTLLAKVTFPVRLRGVSDPMSGFFAVRLGALDLASLKPLGYKVLLEIVARSRLRAAQVPYVFQPRFSGESKASLSEGVRFIRQLVALRAIRRPR